MQWFAECWLTERRGAMDPQEKEPHLGALPAGRTEPARVTGRGQGDTYDSC
jgi:hypothetical protein